MSTDVGGAYRTDLEVYDSDGLLTDSATQTLTVTLPDQTTVTPSVTRDSTGRYHADYLLATEGSYRFVWATTGPNTSRTDYENAVAWRSAIGLAEAREWLALNDTRHDDLLRQIMMTATEKAEDIVGSLIIRQIVDEHVTGTSRQAIRLMQGPLPSRLATVSIRSEWDGGPSWTESDLMIYPDSGIVEPKNYLGFWWGPWKATYTAGRTVIPQKVIQAVKEIVYDLWAPVRSATGDSLEPGLTETADYENAYGAVAHYTIPAHARALLESEAMPGFA